MTERVTSLASNNQLVKYMLKIDKRVFDRQVQLATEKVSSTYAGVATNSERLVNIENTRDLLSNYSKNNTLLDMRLQITETTMTNTDTVINDFYKELVKFRADDKTDSTKVANIQKIAYRSLEAMQINMNTEINGEYTFAGGRRSTQPVDLKLTSLADLQTKWDGANITYPKTRDLNIHTKLTTSTGHPSDPAATGFTDLTITAGAGGTITAAAASMAAQVDTITIGGTVEKDDVYSATVNGTTVTYKVTGLEANLAAVRTAFGALINGIAGVTVTDGVPNGDIIITADVAGTSFNASTKVDIKGTNTDNLSSLAHTTANKNAFANIPVGAKIIIANATSATNNGTFTVASNSGGVIAVSAADTLALATNDTGGGNIQITVDNTYYHGDEVDQAHRVNKNQDISMDLNAVDPAFEKAIRAMFIIAQGKFNTGGGLDQNQGRIDDALYLAKGARSQNPSGTPPYGTELTSNIEQVTLDLGYNRVLIKQSNATSDTLIGFYDDRVTDTENINPVEIISKLLDDQQALEASYQTMARIRQISLLQYLT
ncbi:MAG: hypothetical protein HQ504_08000 [Rhodospirillaceae bacterium]|nr:hypothetical protein [Rhodospirillaceae bacterium]